MSLLNAYRSLADRFGVHLYFAGRSSCKPMLYPERGSRVERVLKKCDEYNRHMLAAIDRLAPGLVILNSYWSLEPEAWRLRPHQALALPVPLEVGVGAALDRIAVSGRRTCIVLDPPTLDYIAPYALAMAERRGLDPGFLQPTREQAFARDAPVDDALRRLEGRSELRIVDPKAALCTAARCAVAAEGQALYYDSNHLTTRGAAAVEGELAHCFEPPATSAARASP